MGGYRTEEIREVMKVEQTRKQAKKLSTPLSRWWMLFSVFLYLFCLMNQLVKGGINYV
jgi:hypothetical protein